MTLPERQYRFLFVRNSRIILKQKGAEIYKFLLLFVCTMIGFIKNRYTRRGFSSEILYFYHFEWLRRS